MYISGMTPFCYERKWSLLRVDMKFPVGISVSFLRFRTETENAIGLWFLKDYQNEGEPSDIFCMHMKTGAESYIFSFRSKEDKIR